MRGILSLFLISVKLSLVFAQVDPCNFEDKSAISKSKKVTKQYLKAKKLLKAKKNEAAIEVLKKSILLDDSCAKCMYTLANQYNKKNQLNLARNYYLKIDSTCQTYNPNTYFNIGMIAYFKSKQMQDDDPELLMCAEYFSKYLEYGDPQKSKFHRAAIKCKECINLYELYADTVPFNPNKVEHVSQNKSTEYFPFLSPDNESLYFTRKGSEQEQGLGAYKKETWYEKLYVRQRNQDEFIAYPLAYPFNQPGITQGAATLTINNSEMYISICNAKILGGLGSCDIFYTKKEYGQWGDFKNLNEIADFAINTENFESMPSISSDGSTLYFVSDRHDADIIEKAMLTGDPMLIDQIDFDIYYTVKQANGRWGEVIRLGPEINSSKNEKTPFIHPDNKTLYFSSQGHYGVGGYDIFYARKNKQGVWDFAKNIGIPINTYEDDGDFIVSTDGLKGYYASYPSGLEMWDVFEFNLPKAVRPKKLVFLKGKVNSQQNDADATVKIRNNADGTQTSVPVNEEGEYAFIAQIEEEEELIPPKITNKALQKLEAIKTNLKSKEELKAILKERSIAPEDSLRQQQSHIKVSSAPPASKTVFGKVDSNQNLATFDFTISTQQDGSFASAKRYTPENTPVGSVNNETMELAPLSLGATFSIDNLLFATDSFNLSESAKIELYVLVDFLKVNKDINIAVHGHTDNIGNAHKNLVLSRNRAKAVHDFLIEQGILSNRLSFDGFGPLKPIASNKSVEGRSKNRRTEIVIIN